MIKEQEFTIKRAMVQSGACNGPWSPAPTFQGTAFSDEQLLRAGYSTKIDRLRREIKNASAFVAAVGALLPTVDGHILVNGTEAVFSSQGLAEAVNVERALIGFNSMDGIAGWPYTEPTGNGSAPKTDDEFKAKLKRWYPDPVHSEMMYLHYYPPSDFAPYHDHTNASIAWYTMVRS